MSDRYNTFLVLGAPGCGKGTQGQILGTIPRFFHCACGEVFRSLDTRTPLGKEFLSYSSRGELVPDDITVQLWKARIDNMVEGREFKPDIDFLILDGIPRNVPQAEIMEEYVDVLQIFHLSCPDREELIRRLRKRALKDNRLDDASESVIAHRLQTYEEETKPVLEFYPDDRIYPIDACQSPAKVITDILDRIMELDAWKSTASLKV
jgi:adenylate kinase